MRRLNQSRPGVFLTFECSIHQDGKTYRLKHFLSAQLCITGERGAFRRKGFPAIIISTGAGNGRFGSYNHVTEFSGRASLATINLAIDDYSGTDTLAHQNQNEIASVSHFRPPKPEICQGNGIRVVVNP